MAFISCRRRLTKVLAGAARGKKEVREAEVSLSLLPFSALWHLLTLWSVYVYSFSHVDLPFSPYLLIYFILFPLFVIFRIGTMFSTYFCHLFAVTVGLSCYLTRYVFVCSGRRQEWNLLFKRNRNNLC